MIGEAELETLMRAASADYRHEPAFLKALLDAQLYTLAPFSDDHPRLRLWMFRRPDGVEFIPYFTNEAQAHESAAGELRVVALPGKLLLKISRGATVVINPNHEACTLYPEEIDALLTGVVATIESERTTQEIRVLAGPPIDPPHWLVESLRTLYSSLPYIEKAWLVDVRPEDNPDMSTMTVCLQVTQPHGDRASHATITAVQSNCIATNYPLDVILSDPTQPLSLTEVGTLIYLRQST